MKNFDQADYLFTRFNLKEKPRKLGKGKINNMWEAKIGLEEVVFRIYPSFFQDKLPYEVNILKFGEENSLPTPKLLRVDKTDNIPPILLYKKIEGSTLGNCLNNLSQNELTAVFKKIKEILNVCSEKFDIGGHCGYLHEEAQTNSLQAYLSLSLDKYLKIITSEELLNPKICLDLKKELKIKRFNDKPQLTYIDLSRGNILISENKLAGLIDWEFLMGANPLMGFGNLLLKEIMLPTSRKVTCSLAQCFNKEELDLISLSGIYRGLELISYLPQTKIYSRKDKSRVLLNLTNAIERIWGENK